MNETANFLTLNKTSSPPFIKRGDIITYTISIINTGNLTATDVVITDNIPSNMSFIPNSLSGDGVNLGINNELIIYIDNINPSSSSTITFDAILNTLPLTGEVHNTAMVGYIYSQNVLSQSQKSTTTSNLAINIANEAILDNTTNGAFTLDISPSYGDIDDVLTYSLTLKNMGNVPAKNVILTCALSDTFDFIENSVYVNNTLKPGEGPSPNKGIYVGDIDVDELMSIIFNVRVISIPSKNIVPNVAIVNFDYTVDPAVPNGGKSIGYSNEATVEVNKAIINYDSGNGLFDLQGTKYAQEWDKITYTYTIGNTGNVPGNNVLFSNLIPKYTTFEENSLSVDGFLLPGFNPSNEITLKSINPGDIVTVSFNVLLTSSPDNNKIVNSANISYEYFKSSFSSESKSMSGTSSVLITEVNKAIISENDFTITCDNKYADIGDILYYVITITNSGNIVAKNVLLRNILSPELNFLSDSFYINDIHLLNPNLNINNGVDLDRISPGETLVVKFNSLVKSLPNEGFVSNKGRVNYSYIIDPALANLASGEVYSNTVKTNVNSILLEGSENFKVVASPYNTLGGIITYSFSIQNKGNISANNVVFKDTIPMETSFIEDSVYINGVPTLNVNPTSNKGISLGNILAASAITFDFKVTVDTIPSINPLKNVGSISYNYKVDPTSLDEKIKTATSNIAVTTINFGDISLTNNVDKAYASTSDILTFTYTINNIGNTPINNILFSTTIPKEASYIPSTLRLKGSLIQDSDFISNKSIDIANIGVDEVITLSFDVAPIMIPNNGKLKNIGTVSFDFIISDIDAPVIESKQVSSNEAITFISQAIIDSLYDGFSKYTNSNYLKFGDVLTYTNILKNTGNATATDVFFTDTLSYGALFIEESLVVNDIPQNGKSPVEGINVGNINPNSTVTIQYNITVDTIPTLYSIGSYSNVTFNYIGNPLSSLIYEGSGSSNLIETSVRQAIIDYGNGNGQFLTSYYNAYSNLNKEITFEFSIANTGNIIAEKVLLTNPLDSCIEFVPNSAYINSVNILGANPENGINIGSLPPFIESNIKLKIKFNAIVRSIPKSNKFTNKAFISYTYNKSNTVVEQALGYGSSNEVTVNINTANLDNTKDNGVVLKVNKSYAKIGDILTYSMNLRNTGNISANNVILLSTLPLETTFVKDSLKLNGITLPGKDPFPQKGVNIGTLPSDLLNVVSYDVTVNSIPASDIIKNSSTVLFDYIYDPNLKYKAMSSGNSNEVTTTIKSPIIDASGYFKVKGPSLAGDTIDYSFIVKNLGNTSANNCFFTSLLPKEASYIADTLKINDNIVPNEDPLNASGVNLGNIDILESLTISFKVRINDFPSVNPIKAQGRVAFNYTVTSDMPNSETSFGLSEIKETEIRLAIIDGSKENGFVKSVDKSFVKRNDTLNYTVLLKNTGNVTAKDVIYEDIIPENAVLLNNSLVINGVDCVNTATLPNLIASIGDISPNSISSILFSVLLKTIPDSLNISSYSQVNFNYSPDNSSTILGSGKSNIVNTEFKEAIIDTSIKREVLSDISSKSARLGDTLIYTLALRNVGSTAAYNVFFTDSISQGISFSKDSFHINDEAVFDINPLYPSKVPLGTINVNETKTINYKVTVETLPASQIIKSNPNITYKYIVDPSIPCNTLGISADNSIVTNVLEAIVDANILSYDKYSTINNEITYKFSISNSGNTDANNVLFKNISSSELAFVPGSLKIDGEVKENANPRLGVALGLLSPLSLGGSPLLIEFKERVVSIPASKAVKSIANISFNYNTDKDDSRDVVKTVSSDKMISKINTAIIDTDNFIISSNRATSAIEDIVTYTISLENTGNVDAINAILTTTFPNEVSLVEDSIYVNEFKAHYINTDNIITINLGTLPNNDVCIVNFKTLINSLPENNVIIHIANVVFEYIYDSISGLKEVGESTSTPKELLINIANIDKSGEFIHVSSPYSKVGDSITYSFKLANTGNTVAKDVIFMDSIPEGLSFIENSVVINGVRVSNANPTCSKGLFLGDINPGSSLSLKFKALASTIPAISTVENIASVNFNYIVDELSGLNKSSYGISNIATTAINHGIIDLNSNVDKKFAIADDILTYTISMENIGNITVNNVLFTSTIPKEMTYIENSLTLDNSAVQLNESDFYTGISIGDIDVSITKTLSFKVKVTSLPDINPVINTSMVNFDFRVSPENVALVTSTGSSLSEVEAYINQARLCNNTGDSFLRYADSDYVSFGNEITYTNILKNTGNTVAADIFIIDTIPNSCSFVSNSLLVNGLSLPNVNPKLGFTIEDINPKDTTTISYKVIVNTVPNLEVLKSSSFVEFKYTLDPSIPKGVSKVCSSNISESTVVQAIINFDNGNGLFFGVSSQEFTTLGNDISIKYTIGNTGNIPANNVIFTNTIPSGLAFVENSLMVNDELMSGINPNDGIDLGTLTPIILGNSPTTVKFKFTVVSIPDNNPISNFATVNFNYIKNPSNISNKSNGYGVSNEILLSINAAIIDNQVEASKAFIELGDLITYKFSISNTGNVAADNIIFKDSIPNGMYLAPKLMVINGFATSVSNQDFNTGISLDSILPGTRKTLAFSLLSTAEFTEKQVNNQGVLNYSYTVDPNTPLLINESKSSNIISTKIAYPTTDINDFVYKADKTYAFINDVVTYTILISNNGNLDINNVLLNTTLPNECTFVENSLLVNGSILKNVSPGNPNGVNLGTIVEGSVSTVSFKLLVATIPSSSYINSGGKVYYTYTVNPLMPNTKSKSVLLNEIPLRVIDNNLDYKNNKSFTLTASPSSIVKGDEISYTISLINLGNIDATNIILKDTLPACTDFIEGSLYINGINHPDNNPFDSNGLNLGSLNSSNTLTVNFKVMVVDVPSNYKITNISTVNYDVVLGDTTLPVVIPMTGSSNETITTFKRAAIDTEDNGFTASVDKYFATVDDILTYTFTLKNTGNISANNLILTNTIPKGVKFVDDSLFINGRKVLQGNPAPPKGVNIGNLIPNTISTVEFKMKVLDEISQASIDSITNIAQVMFEYTLDKSNSRTLVSYSTSNALKTNLVYSVIDSSVFTISSDKKYYKTEDEVNYLIVLTNTANVDISNIVLTNTLPSGIEFLEKSVSINGISEEVADITNGIIIQHLGDKEKLTVGYKAKVVSIPTNNIINNLANISYDYEVDPINKKTVTKTGTSNISTITINEAIIDNNYNGFNLDSDKDYISEGDILTYTITLKNTGNVEANNIVLMNKLPVESSYIPNSLIINGVSSSNDNDNPMLINLDSLAKEATSTIVFKVDIIDTPTPNSISAKSNIIYKYTLDPSLPLGETIYGTSKEKLVIVATGGFNKDKGGFIFSSDKQLTTINDVITYTAILKNIGNTPVNDIKFVDTIPYGIEFIKQSVKINNILDTLANPSINNGIYIGTVNPNEAITITYKANIIAAPKENPTINSAIVKYVYTVDSHTPYDIERVDVSNTIYTNIDSPFISAYDGGFVLTVDKTHLTIGDTLTYTVTVKNTGNIYAEEVIYFSTIPDVTSFVQNSLFVNGVKNNSNIATGVNIGFLGSKAISTITYKVILNKYPAGNILEGVASLIYKYNIKAQAVGIPKINYLADISTASSLSSTSNLLQIMVIEPKLDVEITADKTEIDVNDIYSYTITLRNTGNVAANDILITNTLPAVTSYIDGSLVINGESNSAVDFNNSLNVGNLDINGALTLSFKVKANSIPSNNELELLTSVAFNYNLDPNEDPKTSTINVSNTSVKLNKADIAISYTTENSYITDGDTISYKVNLKNVGNIAANNLLVKALISEESKYIPDSLLITLQPVSIQSSIKKTSSIINGLYFDSLGVDSEIIITYKTKVIDNIKYKDIKSNLALSYSYNSSDTNIVEIKKSTDEIISNYRKAELILSKSQDKKILVLNETINFTVKIRNLGNISANNILIKDILPMCLETNLNSVYINNVLIPNGNIIDGIIIPKIDAYSQAVLTYSAIATKVPLANLVSSIISAKYNYKLSSTHTPITNYFEEISNDIFVIPPICNRKKITSCKNNKFGSNYPLENDYYSINGLCSKEDYSYISKCMKEQYMWSKNEVLTKINLGETPIRSIEGINVNIELIRAEIVDSPYTGSKTNLDNKRLTGNKMIINAVINYTVKYIAYNGEAKTKLLHKLFGAYISINPKYRLENLNVDYCLEDVSITNFCDNTATVLSKILFYLIPEKYCLNSNSSFNTSIYGVSNNALSTDIKNFIKPTDLYWDDFNIYITDYLSIDFYQIISTKAKLRTISSEVIILPQKKLLVKMCIDVNIAYIERSNLNKVQNLKGEIPFSTSITLDNKSNFDDLFDISAAIENIYVGIDNQNLFTNTTIVIKATKISSN